MNVQLSLLGNSSLPEGLHYIPEILTEIEEGELIAHIDTLELTPFQFQQWVGKRKTASFGYHYDYGSAQLTSSAAIPDWLLPIRTRIAKIARLQPAEFAQVMITEYAPGAGIGWHRDRPDFDIIAGVSLLTDCALRFRRPLKSGYQRSSVHLHSRSAYLIKGEARMAWYHSIAPQKERRLSVTFRSLKKKRP